MYRKQHKSKQKVHHWPGDDGQSTLTYSFTSELTVFGRNLCLLSPFDHHCLWMNIISGYISIDIKADFQLVLKVGILRFPTYYISAGVERV
ncbi:hypothetical protein D3C73_1505110 [compost metagenome]